MNIYFRENGKMKAVMIKHDIELIYGIKCQGILQERTMYGNKDKNIYLKEFNNGTLKINLCNILDKIEGSSLMAEWVRPVMNFVWEQIHCL